MNQPTPKEEKYVFVFAKNEDGSDMKYRFMLVLGKQTSMKIGGEETIGNRLIKAVGSLDGVDNVQPDLGRYTMEITIARTFDADEVIEELKTRLDNEVLSEIVRPKIVT